MYALGVCLFRMLTGRLPFNGKTVKQLMSQAMTQSFPDVRIDCAELPNEVAQIVDWLVHRDPQQRAHDADEAQPRLFAALEQIRDVHQLLAEAFDGEQDIAWSARESSNEFDVVVKLPLNRQQRVVIASVDDNVPFRQLQIFSIGGPASPAQYELRCVATRFNRTAASPSATSTASRTSSWSKIIREPKSPPTNSAAASATSPATRMPSRTF